MNLIGTVTLETERLILRKTMDSDVEPMFYNWANDKCVTKYLTWLPYESPEQLRATYHQFLMENQDRPDFFDWKIVLKDTGEPIGSIGVVKIIEKIDAVEIGYCLGYDYWHKGIMTEAFKKVIEFLFDEVGVNRIVAQHDVNNPNSGKVMNKCGLIKEGVFKQGGRNNLGIVDICQHALVREDYRKDC